MKQQSTGGIRAGKMLLFFSKWSCFSLDVYGGKLSSFAPTLGKKCREKESRLTRNKLIIGHCFVVAVVFLSRRQVTKRHFVSGTPDITGYIFMIF